MKLLSLQPGVALEEVLENTGFELMLAKEIAVNQPPSQEELRILRQEVDKDHLYI
jgi:glutaconate CoA-transferase subunit B